MAGQIIPGEDILAEDFINESEKDATPANDEGRVPKLEDDGKVSEEFMRYATKFTAGEDLAANIPVGIGTNGKLSRAVRAMGLDATNIPSNLDASTINKVFSIDTNKFVVLYSEDDNFHAVVFSVDTDTNDITFGSSVQVTGVAENGSGSGGCKLDTNKFIVAYSNDGSNDCEYKVYSVSGVTLTEQSSGSLQSSSVTHGEMCQLATDRFAFFYTAHDTNTTYMGFGTVSGYTPTVVASSSSTLSNFSNTGSVMMAKIATDKFVMLSPETGYAVVCTTVSTTLVIGTPTSVLSGGEREQCSVVSIASNTFWGRTQNDLGYFTVSGTTITTVDTLTLSNGNAAHITHDGTDVYEVYDDGTDNNLSGLYKIVLNGSTVVRTQVKAFVMTGTTNGNGIRGDYDGARYVFIGGVASGEVPTFHIQGMTENFVGFTEEAASKDDIIRVVWKGIIGGQSGIIPGAPYEITDGGLVFNGDPTLKYSAIGYDSTSVFI